MDMPTNKKTINTNRYGFLFIILYNMVLGLIQMYQPTKNIIKTRSVLTVNKGTTKLITKGVFVENKIIRLKVLLKCTGLFSFECWYT